MEKGIQKFVAFFSKDFMSTMGELEALQNLLEELSIADIILDKVMMSTH